MKGTKRNNSLRFVFLAVLIAQLTFHTFHVFSSHTHEQHIELNSGDLVHLTESNCELCAQLVTATIFLEQVELITLKRSFPNLKFIHPTSYFSSRQYSLLHLRGPPQA